MAGIKLSKLKKIKDKYEYRNRLWKLNKPIPSSSKRKKMMVLATKNIDKEKKVKIIHFGEKGYGHNYSKKAKELYLKRSAQIKNKKGELTKDDPWSPNYWSRKILWPKNKPATGPKKT
ncbi:MAG: hypothetical protein AMS24_04665 [Chlamydiae bacterium SM23_39]|nr:MAG: hypothetical protein AMS24_04665 [Chlamydiae bacterium SM23_39]